VRTVIASIARDLRATFLRVMAYVGALAILAVAAAALTRSPPVAAAVDALPRASWIEVERPYAAFELLMPELNGLAPDYAIRRRTDDGSRKDIMTWGAPGDQSPYITVEIYRPGSDAEGFAGASREIADRIVALPVAEDVKAAGALDSKFGPVALVDFALAHEPAPRRCLGFVRASTQPHMQIAGWYCSAGADVVDRGTIACVLDRLTLVSAGSDPRLAAFFAHSELKRKFCGQRDPILAATPRGNWIGAPGAVKLRASLSAR
jgi:hypothetical protein